MHVHMTEMQLPDQKLLQPFQTKYVVSFCSLERTQFLPDMIFFFPPILSSLPQHPGTSFHTMAPEVFKNDAHSYLISQDFSATDAQMFVSDSSTPHSVNVAVPKRVYHTSPLEIRPLAIYTKGNGLFTTHALDEGDLIFSITPPLLSIVSPPSQTPVSSASAKRLRSGTKTNLSPRPVTTASQALFASPCPQLSTSRSLLIQP